MHKMCLITVSWHVAELVLVTGGDCLGPYRETLTGWNFLRQFDSTVQQYWMIPPFCNSFTVQKEFQTG